MKWDDSSSSPPPSHSLVTRAVAAMMTAAADDDGDDKQSSNCDGETMGSGEEANREFPQLKTWANTFLKSRLFQGPENYLHMVW